MVKLKNKKAKEPKKLKPTKVATLNSMRDQIVARRKEEARVFTPSRLAYAVKAELVKQREGL